MRNKVKSLVFSHTKPSLRTFCGGILACAHSHGIRSAVTKGSLNFFRFSLSIYPFGKFAIFKPHSWRNCAKSRGPRSLKRFCQGSCKGCDSLRNAGISVASIACAANAEEASSEGSPSTARSPVKQTFPAKALVPTSMTCCREISRRNVHCCFHQKRLS